MLLMDYHLIIKIFKNGLKLLEHLLLLILKLHNFKESKEQERKTKLMSMHKLINKNLIKLNKA